MAQIIREVSIDVARSNIFQAIIAKQHDSNSRFLKATITNQGKKINIESSSIVTINGEREDGESKAFKGSVNEDGTVTVPLTNWLLELDGRVKCDISIVDAEGRKLTTTKFTLLVEAAAYDGSDITEDEDADLLISILAECAGAKEAAEKAESKENKNQPNGYAGLDENGKIAEEQVPESFAKLPQTVDDIEQALGVSESASKNLCDVPDGEYVASTGWIAVTVTDNIFVIGGKHREELPPYNAVATFPAFTVDDTGNYQITVFADEDYRTSDGKWGYYFSIRNSEGAQVGKTAIICISTSATRTIALTAGETYYMQASTSTAADAYEIGSSYENITFKVQLEKGTTSTEWVSPTGTKTFTLVEDVEELKEQIKDVGTIDIISGKTIMTLGDSIMYGAGNGGTGIGDLLVNGKEATLYDYSQGGATVGYRTASADGSVDYTSGSKQNITYQAELAVAQAVTPDYILINGGTNDIGTLNIDIGEISSGFDAASVDKTTFTGGLEYIFGKLKAAYPSAHIMYIRVHNMGSRDYTKQVNYGKRAFEICEKWSIPTVNIFGASGLNTNIAEMHRYTYVTETSPNGDKTHPNAEGYAKFYIPLILHEMAKHI